MNANELNFAVFCVEWVAECLRIDADQSYRLLSEQSDLLYGYIVPNYEPLHTQGKDYIVREIVDLMRERGIIE